MKPQDVYPECMQGPNDPCQAFQDLHQQNDDLELELNRAQSELKRAKSEMSLMEIELSYKTSALDACEQALIGEIERHRLDSQALDYIEGELEEAKAGIKRQEELLKTQSIIMQRLITDAVEES